MTVPRSGDRPDLSDAAQWIGGSIEAAVVLGRRSDAGSDARVLTALSSAWSHPSLDGFYSGRFTPAGLLERCHVVDASTVDPRAPGRQLGWLHVGGARWAVAATMVLRETTGSPSLDWLDIVVPIGSLAHADERVGGFPYGDLSASREWMEPLFELLGDVARRVCVATTAMFGVVGFEIAGAAAATDGAGPLSGGRVGYLVREGTTYRYRPPTAWP